MEKQFHFKDPATSTSLRDTEEPAVAPGCIMQSTSSYKKSSTYTIPRSPPPSTPKPVDIQTAANNTTNEKRMTNFDKVFFRGA